MMLEGNLNGQENFENEINSFLESIESEHYTFILNNYKIEEGKKNKKNEKKRIVISEIDFELPYNLTLCNFELNGIAIHKIDKNNKDYISPNELLKGYAANIFTNDYLNMGIITVTYTNSQYLARRILASNISGLTNRLLRADEFSRPNIGDDICLLDKEISNGYHKIWIHFIRDCTVFKIGINNPKDIDIEKLARNIDQKFTELNKKLNEKEGTVTD
jgi:hypothetical protein